MSGPAGRGRQPGGPGMRKWYEGGAGWGRGTATWDGGNMAYKKMEGCMTQPPGEQKKYLKKKISKLFIL